MHIPSDVERANLIISIFHYWSEFGPYLVPLTNSNTKADKASTVA